MPENTAKDLTRAYDNGMKLLASGKHQDALAVFSTIHDANPLIAEVEYQIANVLLRLENYPQALRHAIKAAELAPGQPAVWETLAKATALEGSAAARTGFLTALKVAKIPVPTKTALADRFGPGSKGSSPKLGGAPATVINPLMAALKAQNWSGVIAQSKKVLAAYPNCAFAANACAIALANQGKQNEALAWYARATKMDGAYSEAYMNMANLFSKMNQGANAKEAYQTSICLSPDFFKAICHIAQLCYMEGKFENAQHWLNRATLLQPKNSDLHLLRGNTFTKLRNYPAAYEAFLTAEKLISKPDSAVFWMLAQAESKLQMDAAAEAHFNQAIALAPGNAEIMGSKAVFLQGLGRFEEGEAMFLEAIKSNPKAGEIHRHYYTSHKAKKGEPLIEEMKVHFRDPQISDRDRMHFGFAIAKATEDTKSYEQVFDFLDPANALVRKLYPYDVADRETQIDGLVESLQGMDWNRTPILGTTDAAPIFVTGMPRSGTTLIEQIISSHSMVSGAGEVGLRELTPRRFLPTGLDGKVRPATLIKDSELVDLGNDYAAMMREKFPETPQITDKSIQTYMTLGLTKLAMPNARFIVVRRDPRDTLLSMYKNVFPEGTHLYAYDQVDLARYYATFVRMVDFWRERVPDWFYEVQYEDLVADPETQSRALIAACGLEWEDACLNFHENTRKVETLSVFQVRQPISKGSVRAWERYGNRLAPMINRLRADGMIEG
ncbi:MAG: sulfotransferase [Paracoccaceae bacterium]